MSNQVDPRMDFPPLSQTKMVLWHGPRATMAIISILILVAAWFGGERAISTARMSRAIEFIRGCGGHVHSRSEDHNCWIRDGHFITSHNFNNSPYGIDDYRWSRLLLAGLRPEDVNNIEIPIEVLAIGGSDFVQRVLETACTFPELECLDIPCASVSANDVSRLANLSKLRLLRVSATSDRAALRHLREANAQMQIYLTDPETCELTPLR
jgi:hypothetical protein